MGISGWDLGVQVTGTTAVRNSEGQRGRCTLRGARGPSGPVMNRTSPGLELYWRDQRGPGLLHFSGTGLHPHHRAPPPSSPAGKLVPTCCNSPPNYEIPRSGQGALVSRSMLTGSLRRSRVALGESSPQPPPPRVGPAELPWPRRPPPPSCGGAAPVCREEREQGSAAWPSSSLASLAIEGAADELGWWRI